MNLRKNERLAELEEKVKRLENFMPIVEGCLITLSEWLHVNQQFALKLQTQAKARESAKSTEESKTEATVGDTPETVTTDN